jgi:hypothetical protein
LFSNFMLPSPFPVNFADSQLMGEERNPRRFRETVLYQAE